MEKRRSLPGAPQEKREREEEGAGSHPLVHSVARTEPVGDCRVAINAVELTPGCPFAGKVRLKERRNGRQLPRSASERVRESGGRRGRGHEGNWAQSMSITPVLQSPLFCCSLCLPLGVVSLRLVFVVVDVNDIFIFDKCARLEQWGENILPRRYAL